MGLPGVKYSLGRLIVCEGSVDVAFIERLILDNSLRRSHVRHSGGARSERGGKSKFAETLIAARVNPSFRKTVKEVVLIADSDDDPTQSFHDLVQQLQRAGLNEPAAPRQWSAGSPKTAIFLLPPNAAGALESYAKDSARSVNPNLGAFVDQFVDLAAMHWRETERDKLWFRSFLSARNRRDPNASSFRVVKKNDPAIADYTHHSLNGLVAFLR